MREFFMTMLTKFLTAAAVIGGLAVPAAAQAPYPYRSRSSRPIRSRLRASRATAIIRRSRAMVSRATVNLAMATRHQQDGLGQIVGQLLGNRYNVTDRTAVQQCASAAMSQASAQYRPQPYGNAYGYNHRLQLQRRISAGLRRAHARHRHHQRRAPTEWLARVRPARQPRRIPPNGQAYGYQNNGYAATGDLSFRCNVDYRGAVTNVRVRQANAYRG